MKITIPLTSESMDAEEFMEDAKNAAEFLRGSLNKIFDEKWSVDAFVPKSGFLSSCLIVNMYNVPIRSSELDRLNAKFSIKCMMHLADDSGRLKPKDKFDLELNQMSYRARDKGLKFRKISGKSPMECATKFMAWVKKNIDVIKADYEK